MTRLFGISFMLLSLFGCASPGQVALNINTKAIEGGDIAYLKANNNAAYVTSSRVVSPAIGLFSNAMEAAIYHKNIEAVRYLISINAANQVSPMFIGLDGMWTRTAVNVTAAELACGVAAFDIMELLLESYPSEKLNYTNCLHYLVASYQYYPSQHFAIQRDSQVKNKDWRNGKNTAIAVEKIIALGGDPNTPPEYGLTLHGNVFRSFTNNMLTALLEHGMDPNQPYPCTESGHCLILTDLGNYIDEDLSSERARLLIQYGADVNAVTQTPVINALDAWGIGQYKNQGMSALHMARFFDRDKLAATLIELGADPTLTNNEGKNAESYAGAYAQIKATQTQQAAVSQQAATANTNQDSGGSGLGTLMNIIGAVGAGAW